MNKHALIKEAAEKLYFMSFDCYNADFFLSNEEYSGHDKCLKAIDDIYRFFKAGLIRLPSQKNHSGELDAWQVKAYLELLLVTGSYKDDQDKYINWVKFDICLTDLAKQVVRQFCLKQEGALDLEPFGRFIDNLFETHGVGWRDQALAPLFKI